MTTEDIGVQKAESSTRTVVPRTLETGQPRIITGSNYIQGQFPPDLCMPKRFCTFDNMIADEFIYTPMDATNLVVEIAMYGGGYSSETSTGKVAAEFLNYCIRNMSQGTWLDSLRNANTDLTYGFSIQNIVTEKRGYGPYKGNRVLKKLSPRVQKSLYGWLWNKKQTELLGFVQRPPLERLVGFKNVGFSDGLRALSAGKYYKSDYPIIKTEHMLHFKYNSTNNNPQGDSPLLHCYNAWSDLNLINRYTTIGVGKDMGGIVVLRVPAELVTKANDPETYPEEAREYAAIQKDAAALHAGENTLIVLLSDADEVTKKYHYDFELKGITGGGKQYNTTEIITEKKKSIYNTFGAGFLLLGQDSVGSFNLSSNAASTHAQYVERNILQKEDVLNTQLAPRLLAANNIYLDYKDMPIYQAKNMSQVNKDELSKVVQRVASVGKMTPTALEKVYIELGWPTDGIEELDFTDKGQSRAGESEGTSGTGSVGTGGATSTSNLENSDTSKSLIEDGKWIVDIDTDKPINGENQVKD